MTDHAHHHRRPPEYWVPKAARVTGLEYRNKRRDGGLRSRSRREVDEPTTHLEGIDRHERHQPPHPGVHHLHQPGRQWVGPRGVARTRDLERPASTAVDWLDLDKVEAVCQAVFR
ncbi:hypothetical protein GAY28_08475 [Azospirillum brasilense]|nr:hypothetical protein [Azospirillum brasilense]